MDFEFERCSGEGQGECRRCADKGKWNRHWMTLLYKVDGLEGVYCRNCVEELWSIHERMKNYEQKRT